MIGRGRGFAILLLIASARAQDEPPSYAGNRCVECHAGLTGRLQQVTLEWRSSSHFQKGVACDGCHGGDARVDKSPHDPSSGFVGTPRLRDVAYRCGKCHEAIKEKHLGSPHGAQGLPHCVSCHGSHHIVAPIPSEIIREDACTKCHGFEPAATALDALARARATVAQVEETIAEIQHIPQIEAQLGAFQNSMALDRRGVLATFHSFRIGEIERIGMNAKRLEKMMIGLVEREAARRASIADEIPFILGLMTFLLLSAGFGYLRYHGIGRVDPDK